MAACEQQLIEAQQRITQLEHSLSSTSAELRVSKERVAQLEEANRKLSEEVEAGVQLSVDVVNLKQDLEAANRQLESQQLAHRTKLNKFGLQVCTSQQPALHFLLHHAELTPRITPHMLLCLSNSLSTRFFTVVASPVAVAGHVHSCEAAPAGLGTPVVSYSTN